MFRRTVILIATLFSISTQAQVLIDKGEILLRGTIIKAKENTHLILNPKTRAMKIFDLYFTDANSMFEKYKSGTNVEICLIVRDSQQTNNFQAEATRVRPLAPSEAIIYYSGKLPACSIGSGCKKFGNFIPAPTLGEAVSLRDLSLDYLTCHEQKESNSTKKKVK